MANGFFYETVLNNGAVVASPTVPVTLFQIDDLNVAWKGTAALGQLNAGDVLTLDSEALTVTYQAGGVGPVTDVVRYYTFSGPGTARADGFPSIQVGGSNVAAVHPNVASLAFDYDTLFL